MSIINFNKASTIINTSIKRKAALPAVIKYATSGSLPTSEEKNVMIFTSDTCELYQGDGNGKPLKLISSVITVANAASLPASPVKDKIYIAQLEGVAYFSNGTAYVPLAGGSGGGAIDPVQLATIQAAIDSKAAATDLANYRSTSVKLMEADCSAALLNKINSNDNYRSSIVDITEADIDAALASKINNPPIQAGVELTAKKGVANGYCPLAADGKVDAAFLPAATGGGGAVTSVAGKTGAVTLAIADIASLQTNLNAKQNSLGYTAEDASKRGAINGFASLDATGKVPASQLPASTGGAVSSVAGRSGDVVIVAADIADLHTHANKTIIDGLTDVSGVLKYNGADIGSGGAAYVHPATHPATIIVEDATHKFTTQAQQDEWSAKQAALGFTPEDSAKKGAVNGYASLGADGKVPAAQLPAATGGGGSTIVAYEAVGSTNGDCMIVATGAGVSFSKVGSLAVITPPAGVMILSARVRFSGAEVGAASACSVNFNSTLSDTDYVNIDPPTFQFYNDLPAGRVLRSATCNLNVNAHTMAFNGLLASTGVFVKLNY